MKLGLDITPDLVAVMVAEIKAGEKAVSAAMREAGSDLKSAWRGQITQSGLGRRLANSIRSQTYPKAGDSLKAASLVWSKAPQIVSAHDAGKMIRSKSGFWLAIPTAAAGKGPRGRRITPGQWEQRRGLRLRFVYRRGGPSLLVADGRLIRRALAIAEKVQGPEHHATGTCLNNLADLLQYKGNYDAAEPLFRRALRIFERSLGQEHQYTAITKSSLKALLEALNPDISQLGAVGRV